jgi:hypothetical protein
VQKNFYIVVKSRKEEVYSNYLRDDKETSAVKPNGELYMVAISLTTVSQQILKWFQYYYCLWLKT